ncbi:MAG: efflux RND transporter periplasmic adaptor subunit [Oryzomicrobium sp.]|nr:efflux RND transporter periplasmic adaptor subunit [Oryzomicrobium sp.]
MPAALVLGAASLSNAETAGGDAAPATSQAAQAAVQPPAAVPPPKPVPAVAVVHPRNESWPDLIEASGNVMPWQETSIGAEVGGLRLSKVLVTVGDTVKKGQPLARLDAATVETDLDAANAQLSEAQAALAQATATLERGRRLAASGGVSQQELTLFETQRRTAEARLSAAQAQVKRQQLRLDNTTLVAPDDGMISASSAAEGTIVSAGSELFRLIRQGRLEWRAEVKGETLLRLSPGQEVTVKSPLGPEVKGRVRQVSPTINVTTGNGLAYVDLPAGTNLKAGLNVSGTISMGKRKALALPKSAVVRDPGNGSARVLTVNDESRIDAVDIKTGRSKDGLVEIVAGLDERAQVVLKGQKGLAVGDAVKTGADAN